VAKRASIIPTERIERSILLIRGQRVILDSDLAELYGVPTKRLNEQIKRNADRFPEDFMFQLSKGEHTALRSQFATSKTGRWGASISLLCLHRARGHHGRQRPQFQSGR
jgi:hypothetical protein